MAVTHKGSRPITLDGRPFRWRYDEWDYTCTVFAEDRSFYVQLNPAFVVLLRGNVAGVPNDLRLRPTRIDYPADVLGVARDTFGQPSGISRIFRWLLDDSILKTAQPMNRPALPPKNAPPEPTWFLTPTRPQSVALRTELKHSLGPLLSDPTAAQLSLGNEEAQRKRIGALWEALALRELIPQTWAHGEGPLVLTHQTLLTGQEIDPEKLKDPREAWVPSGVPATLSAARCLAEAPQGILRAEALAKEFQGRLLEWFLPDSLEAKNLHEAQRVQWLCLAEPEGPAWQWAERPDPLSAFLSSDPPVWNAIAQLLEESLPEPLSPVTAVGLLQREDVAAVRLAHRMAADLTLHDRWNLACAYEVRVPAREEIPTALRGELISELPALSEPLHELWKLGYALVSMEEGAITLAAVLAPLTRPT